MANARMRRFTSACQQRNANGDEAPCTPVTVAEEDGISTADGQAEDQRTWAYTLCLKHGTAKRWPGGAAGTHPGLAGTHSGTATRGHSVTISSQAHTGLPDDPEPHSCVLAGANRKLVSTQKLVCECL